MLSMPNLCFWLMLYIWGVQAVPGSHEGLNHSVCMVGCMEVRGMVHDITFTFTILNPNRDLAVVSVSYLNGQSRNFTLQSKTFHTETFNADFEISGSSLSSKGIKVESDIQLFVYGLCQQVSGMGGFLSLPIESQHLHYYIVTGKEKTEFLIIGVFPNTCVHIMLRATNNYIKYRDRVYNNGSLITEILYEYDTMQIQGVGVDFTGTEIRTSKAVSVFGGSKHEGSGTSGDHFTEQLPPLPYWGKQHVTAPPADGFKYDCKIMSGFPSTIVTYACSNTDETSIVLHEAGSFQTLEFNAEYCLVTANQPILVTMIVTLNDGGRPCMITLQPLERVAGELMVYVPSGMVTSRLVLVTNASITIDPVPTASTTLCPSHLYYCVRHIEGLVDNQTYTIRSSDDEFLITGYLHATDHGDQSIGFPIIHHTVNNGAIPSDPLTCDNDTNVMTTSPTSRGTTPTDEPDQTLNKTCICCSSKNYSAEELESMIKVLRDELLLKPNTTNMYLRSLTSAPDPRVSSKVIGYTAGSMLVFFGICLVVADMGSLLGMLKCIKRNALCT